MQVGSSPRVSVVMAVYNGLPYLRRAIDSVLEQTLRDIEFVIVDDASVDATPEVLASYSDPRIVVVKNETNMGLTKSLNRGIAASRAPLIARQDADDFSFPDRLSRQVLYLESHCNIGLVGSGALWIDANDSVIQEWRPICDPVQIHQVLLGSIPFLHGTFMFRRECMNDVGGGYNEAMPVAQDCDLLLRISERWDLANLPDLLYGHRRHGGSITAKRKDDQERYLRFAQQAAVQRRLAYGWGKLRLSKKETPGWVKSADRRWLAQRYVWWSASARVFGKRIATQFLIIALVLDAACPPAYQYMAGILHRKAIGPRGQIRSMAGSE